MSNKTTFHIAFCVNNAYVNHLIVTIYSLLVNNSKYSINIHILSSDLSKESKLAINTLKVLGKDVRVTYHSIDQALFKDMQITMDYITVETYYRLMLAKILDQSIESVLYLDADILVIGDVSRIFGQLKNNDYAAAVPDIYLDRDDNHKSLVGLGGGIYVNAGVMVYNLTLIREKDMTESLLRKAVDKRYKYQDQDALNATFKDAVSILGREYNYQIKDTLYDVMPQDEMTILHYSGSKKPWNRDRPYDAFSMLYDDYKLRASRHINSGIPNIKYGLLKYSTDNVGDTIQGIAARKFLPRVDYYFERDNMDATKTMPGEAVKIIMNGWWGDGPENWPPLDQNLEILPVSMYVEDRIQEEFKKPRSRQLLNFFGPVGARSKGTLEFLQSIGVESYFSGCMTLTLNRDMRISKRPFVLAVDVSDAVYERMLQQTDRKVIRLDVMRALTNNIDEQQRLAEFYLYIYQSAHSVVTSRLHTMLPCIALGTPVLFINDILEDDNVRFAGLAELSHRMSSREYIDKPHLFDINNPPESLNKHLEIRMKLENVCREFTGYMSDEGFMTRSVDELLQDENLIQATLGGLEELGNLRIENARLAEMLSHKEHHVEELSQQLEKEHSRYKKIVNSRFWRMTKPLRGVGGHIKRVLR